MITFFVNLFTFMLLEWAIIYATGCSTGTAIVAAILLVIPYNLNGTIFTVFGSTRSEGSIYSACSIFQESRFGRVWSMLALYQMGADTFAFSACYQSAKHRAGALLAGVQDAAHSAASLLAILQVVGENERLFAICSLKEE